MSIRIARKIAKLTQSELAKRAGLTNFAISRLERAGAPPRVSSRTIAGLARALGLNMEEVIALTTVRDPFLTHTPAARRSLAASHGYRLRSPHRRRRRPVSPLASEVEPRSRPSSRSS